MSILNSVLLEELERQEKNLDSYKKKLSELPKGYIFVQHINGHDYCYRKWREKKKIFSEYIGEKNSLDAVEAEDKCMERKETERHIKQLEKENDRLRKALRHYGLQK